MEAPFWPSGIDTVQGIRKVTVAGVTGAIGASLIGTLNDAGFQVRALTRSTSSAVILPHNVEVIEVDYTHSEQLEAALLGQEVVVSTLGDTVGAVAAQEALIHASLAVGVKRFIPSEFGSDTMNERVRSFPFFTDKLRHQDLLKDGSLSNYGFSYSIFITGPFLDWGLSVVPFIINVGTKSAEVFDGGDVPFSTTRVSTLGKAIVSSLRNFDATANRTLYIHDAIVTQNQLVEIEESLTSNHTFERKHVDTTALEAQAWEDYNDPGADPLTWIFPFVNLSIWSKEQLCAFPRTDNKMLGVSEIRGAELKAVLKTEIKRAHQALASTSTTLDEGSCTTVAEKAFEEGKRRLDGFVRPRTKSQLERVVG